VAYYVIDKGPTYFRIRERESGLPAIYCKCCGMISYNPNDIRQAYCGHCHCFHADMARNTTQQQLESGPFRR
jgi:hypothetical protein